MRDLLLLCTKNVHFSYNGDIYTKPDGVTIGLPLGPVLAGIVLPVLPTLDSKCGKQHWQETYSTF